MVRSNIRFLRAFVGDGSSPATFCRMLPYVGTAAQQRLLAEGRFYETNLQADYNFLDPRLDVYYRWVLTTFESRNFTRTGTLNLMRIVQFQANLRKVGPVLDSAVRGIVSANNQSVFDLLEHALEYVESSDGATNEDDYLRSLTDEHDRCDARTRLDLGAFELLFAQRSNALAAKPRRPAGTAVLAG